MCQGVTPQILLSTQPNSFGTLNLRESHLTHLTSLVVDPGAKTTDMGTTREVRGLLPKSHYVRTEFTNRVSLQWFNSHFIGEIQMAITLATSVRIQSSKNQNVRIEVNYIVI